VSDLLVLLRDAMEELLDGSLLILCVIAKLYHLLQCPSILIVVNVAVPNCFPHVPHLESYPHHHGPLDVVHLGEGRPPAAGTDVPDNGLDPMVTMVPVQGGRAAPPVKAVITVDPAAGTSVPI
jgi:hypothetical protein